MIAVPLLALVVPPPVALGWTAMADLVSGLTLLPRVWRDVPFRSLWAVVVGIWVGQLVGTEVLVRIPRRWAEVLIALVVAAMAVRLLRAKAPEVAQPGSRRGALLAGMAGGAMGGVVGMSGPPVVTWATRRFPPTTARATLVAVFAAGSVGQATILWGRGLLPIDASLLVLVPTTLVANAVGIAAGRRMRADTFRLLVAALLGFAALALYLRGAFVPLDPLTHLPRAWSLLSRGDLPAAGARLAVGQALLFAPIAAMALFALRRRLRAGAVVALAATPLVFLVPLPVGPLRIESALPTVSDASRLPRPIGGCVIRAIDSLPTARTTGWLSPAHGIRPCPGGDGPVRLPLRASERPWVAADPDAPLASLAARPWLDGSGTVDLLVRVRGLHAAWARWPVFHTDWSVAALPMRVVPPPDGDGRWRRVSDVPTEVVRIAGGTSARPTVRTIDGGLPMPWDDASVARRLVVFPPLEGWTAQDLVDRCSLGPTRRFGCGLTPTEWPRVTDPALPRERSSSSPTTP